MPSVSAVVFRNGEVVWQEALGLADVDATREATPDTQYRIGSITKTFTAACVLALRDGGDLDLTDADIDRACELVPSALGARVTA